MKKIITLAALGAGALALAACGGKTEEAPAAEPMAAETMAPVEETPAADELDATGNPIGMGAPAESATATETEMAPAAE